MSNVPEKVVGIAGGSCSGTTTLIGNLSSRLGERLSVFPFDDLFIGERALEGIEVVDWESPDLYRWSDLYNALVGLKQGHTADIAAHSRESTEAGVTSRIIEPRPIVVVAGFLALHDEAVRPLYDTTIYIDIPEDEIVRRRKQRAEEVNSTSRWDTDEYVNGGLLLGHRKYVEPQRELAEHVVDGLVTREALVNEVVGIAIN